MEPMRGTQNCMRRMRDGNLYGGYVRDAEHAAVMSANDVIWTRSSRQHSSGASSDVDQVLTCL